jgi:hypothetical protein
MVDKLYRLAQEMAESKIQRLSYRERTIIERELFQMVSNYVLSKFEVRINSFNSNILNSLVSQQQEKKWENEDLNVVIKAFNVQRLIAGLSSSDPYWVDDVETELGGKGKAIINLGIKLIELIDYYKLRS